MTVTYSWTGTDGDPWDATVFPTIRHTIGGAHPTPTIQTNRGHLVTAGTPGGGAGGGDRSEVVCFTADTYTDTEVIVAVQCMEVGTYVEVGYRVGSNITSGDPHDGYQIQWDTDGDAVNVYDLNTGFILQFARSLGLDTALAYWFRIYCRGTRHRMKWWPVGDTEPGLWGIDFNDTHYTDGRVFIGAFNTDTSIPGDVYFDDLHITEIVPPPPGIRYGGDIDTLSALYMGDHVDVDAVYVGDHIEVPVPL